MRRFRCPYCGGNELQGRCCAYCDSIILEEEPEEAPQVPQPAPKTDESDLSIYRGYDGCNTYVELQADAVSFRNNRLGKPDVYHRIRYKDIRSLHYYRPKDKMVAWGHIVIRWTENEHLPVPKRDECNAQSFNGDTLICFSSGLDDRMFIQIFWYLRSMAPAGIPWGIDSVDRLPKYAEYLVHRMDYDRYFRDCNPYRESAVDMLLKETTLSRKEAWALINKVYDQWQATLYEGNPAKAKMDLQRMIKRAMDNDWRYVLE